jgi:hypothetical protein
VPENSSALDARLPASIERCRAFGMRGRAVSLGIRDEPSRSNMAEVIRQPNLLA